MSEETTEITDEEQPTRSVDELVEELAGASRRARQDASHELAIIARRDPAALESAFDALVDALYRPEALTRWEILSALAELCPEYADALAPAFDGAEASLFDEGSATVRLAAFLFLCALGATTPERSDDAWPLLDEAIQCYHGDAEYRAMLEGLLDFVRGDISKETKKALVERVSFDAENGVGYIKTFSAQIVAESKKRKRKK